MGILENFRQTDVAPVCLKNSLYSGCNCSPFWRLIIPTYQYQKNCLLVQHHTANLIIILKWLIQTYLKIKFPEPIEKTRISINRVKKHCWQQQNPQANTNLDQTSAAPTTTPKKCCVSKTDNQFCSFFYFDPKNVLNFKSLGWSVLYQISYGICVYGLRLIWC